MPKENNATVEVLAPAAPNIRAQLDAYIEQKIAEMVGADFTGILEPFFQRKAIAHEIRKLQTLPQQRKWSNYFAEWGCLVCAKKDVPYQATGMCVACHQRTLRRLQTILRFTEKERPDSPPFAPDRATDLACAAVEGRPSSPDLAWELGPPASRAVGSDEDSLFIAAGIPPIEIETRSYVAKSERRPQRNAARDAQRQAARNLRDRGWSWKAITERLDPEGFAKDAARATVRMQVSAHRYVPLVRDLAELAGAAVAESAARHDRLAAAREKRARKTNASYVEIWRQARALRAEGLTWREIAQLLDPDFAKDPDAAIARIMMGARRSLGRNWRRGPIAQQSSGKTSLN